MYAEVLIEYNSKAVDKTFTYIVPEALISKIKKGMKVRVPFTNKIINGFKEHLVTPSMNLTNKIIKRAEESKQPIHVGAIMTTEVFGPYVDDEAIVKRVPEYLDVLGEEMEAYALIHVANSFKREAAAIVTAVDSKFSDKILTIEEREKSLDDMIKLGLDALI